MLVCSFLAWLDLFAPLGVASVTIVINRGNGRANVFHKPEDFAAFERILSLACERFNMRLLGWVLMTNHFHLVLWPRRDGDLQAFMQWATTCHVRRYHRHYKGSGHVWQGRYRSFPIEPGGHLLTVLRYVERNPVRAGMVAKAQDWLYSSAKGLAQFRHEIVPDPLSGAGSVRGSGTFSARQTSPAGKSARPHGAGEPDPSQKLGQAPQAEPDPISAPPLAHWLVEGPTPRPQPWLRFVNREEEAEQLAKLRECVNRGSPFGDDAWRKNAARKLGLESTIRPRGRPKKTEG
jgi:putative transposase